MKITEAIFAIVDTETTGLEREKGDELVEVAAFYWRFGTGLFGVALDTLVDPGRDIPPMASAVHHITARDIAAAGAPNVPEALDLLDRYIGKSTVCVAHNAEFDRAFLPVLDDRTWLCSKRLAQHVCPDAPAFNNQVLRYVFGGINLDLQGLPPHRALADTIVTAFNLRNIIEQYLLNGGADDVAAVIALAQSPIVFKRIPFGKHAGELFSEIPKDYLRWMVRQADMDADMKHTARVHLGELGLHGAA
jgi:exodeoxyribonuclease X